MNREIKFRAWDNEREFMITSLQGIYTVLAHCMQITRPSGFSDCDMSPKKNRYELMQYTGLKDKNGVEIYEGDIVKHSSYYCGDYRQSEGEVIVKFEELSYNSELLVGYADHPSWCEVIGNVYDNKELLGDD